MKRGLWRRVREFMGRKDAAEWTMAALTLAIVILTVVTTYFNCRQISISEETAYADLRAYVQVVNPRDDHFQTEPFVWINVVNFGKTPANKVSIYQQFTRWKRDTLPEPQRSLKGNVTHRFMIAPSETLSIPVRIREDFWGGDSTYARQIYGFVSYEDHRGMTHETFFAYQREAFSRFYRRMASLNYGD